MQKRLTQNVIAFTECSLSNKKKNKKKNCILKKQNEITNNETKKTKQKKKQTNTQNKSFIIHALKISSLTKCFS